MIRVELIYDSDCPNVEQARINLTKALADLPVSKKWTEWNRTKTPAPPYVRQYGSPTILINGMPIGKNLDREEANSCSLYRDEERHLSGVPTVNCIRMAIQEVLQKSPTRTWLQVVSRSVANFLALFLAVSCPLCWPAYAALLSVLGIGFFNYTPYVIPLFIGLFGLVCFFLWRDWRFHKKKFPLVATLIGGALFLIAKLFYPMNLLIYSGIAILIIGSISNLFYVYKTKKTSCIYCSIKKGDKKCLRQ